MVLCGLTDVEVVSGFLGWEFTSFLDDAVPAIVGAVLVDFFG